MNRIYQGKVTAFELKSETGDWESRPVSGDQASCPLWNHHAIFQDAVNYYLVALGAMAQPGAGASGRLVSDLRSRLAEAWERFPREDASRKGARSLRDSIGPWIGLEPGASIEDAYQRILAGNSASSDALGAALTLLLEKCSGDSAIQQGGRTYLPRLCDAKYVGSFDYSAEALVSASGKADLAAILHGNPDDDALRAIASRMDLSWTVKIQPDKFFEGEEASHRVRESLDHLAKMIANPTSRLAAWLEGIADPGKELGALREMVASLPPDLKIPRNRKAAPDLTFASIAFMVFPCQLTAACLRQGVKEPAKASKKAPVGEGSAHSQLGDDPIRLARGTRGYVFAAFTALEPWSPADSGRPQWKDFDIAAFKEALTSLNQFNQKTKDREAARLDLRGRIAYTLGTPLADWKPAKTESDEEAALPPILGTDHRFTLARQLEARLTEDLNETGSSTGYELPGGMIYRESDWKVSRASLRGFRDIAEKWNQAYRRAEGRPDRAALEEIVKDYQRDEKNRKSVGSLPLLLSLCDETYWPLWVAGDGDDDGGDDDSGSNALNKSGGMLFALADFHEVVRDYQRACQPINLTPAEPRHSRRLFMFSDVMTGSQKAGLGGAMAGGVVTVPVAMGQSGQVSRREIRLRFSAPRLHRDRLVEGGETAWLQPMMECLPIERANFVNKFALELMPDFTRSGEARHLLNFPVDLDAGPIHAALGKAGIWQTQFNGTRGKSLHLHWPGTATDVARRSPWWQSPKVIRDGFTILSTDLGQRTAGAWALLRITVTDPRLGDTPTRRPVRVIGSDGERTWFAEVLKTGIHRLPGEDAAVLGPNGRFSREAWGKAGRNAQPAEWEQARRLAVDLLAEQPDAWVGATVNERSYPEQNDALLALANRRLSRLGTFHRWSCFDPDRPEVVHRRVNLIDALRKELEAWQDAEVQALIPTLGDPGDGYATCDPAALRALASSRFRDLRAHLERILVALAGRVAPLRDRSWVWRSRQDGTPYGELVDTGAKGDDIPLIRGQRGLSMARIEQLDTLRRLFLRYNRALDREPGVPAPFGVGDRGRQSGEPCPALLEKIDAMKAQRIDQTAHLILALALGVRLKADKTAADERRRRDLHGEYECIPGREPVDFIVIENLDRYLTSQGRAPSENSRLMKWAHRAVRDKLKMLAEEPFGIPVVETAAAYSSRFCAVTGQPGARGVEVAGLSDFDRRRFQKRADEGGAEGAAWRTVLDQFDRLAALNASRAGRAPRTLLLPRAGGPLFLPLGSGGPVQADQNAAINLGLRAVAAPDRFDLLHKLRTRRDGGQYLPVAKNKREEAVFKKTATPIVLDGDPSRKLAAAPSPNFFHDGTRLADHDRGTLRLGAMEIPVASGIGLWGTVNRGMLSRIISLNQARLAQWGGDQSHADSDDAIPGIG